MLKKLTPRFPDELECPGSTAGDPALSNGSSVGAVTNHQAHQAHEDTRKMHGRHDQPGYVPLPIETERLIREVIGAAIAVHRRLGPGFLESVYHRAMAVELQFRGVPFEEQHVSDITYRGVRLCSHRLDLVVGNAVVVELKAVKRLRPIHEAQLLSYLKATGMRAGLLINFNVRLLVNGLRRFVR